MNKIMTVWEKSYYAEQPRFTTKDFHTIMGFCEGWVVNELH